jgi:Ca-activated chloride channel family protein
MSRARGLLLSVVSTLALSGLSLVTGCASHKSEAPEGAAEVGVISAEADEAYAVEEAAPPASPAPARSIDTGAPARAYESAKSMKAPTRAPSLDAIGVAEAPAPPPSAGPRGGGTGAPAKKSKEEAYTRYAPPASKPMPITQAAPPAEALAVREQANTEVYTDHGLNPFTMVAEDAQSTFSIDVDTASYTMARKKLLQAGSLPAQASVRVEEFVNYFDYDYKKPDGGPFAVDMEAMPDPFRPGHHIVRVGVQGQELARDARAPVHLTFLVDVSGSMSSPDKLPLAKQAMHLMVDGLREDDTIALATYAGNTARILEPTKVVNKRKIHDAIDALGAGGSTAMSAGIDIAYDMANKSFVKGHENRVVILSDGDANVGFTSYDSLLSQIKTSADKGVTLSTIGFGMGNYKDTLMEQLSNKGDGNNFYIDDATQAKRVFVEKLGGTLVTIARDVKIQVEWNPQAVTAYRLVGYENRDIADKDFRNDRVDAGEVGSGHQVTALYEVVLKDNYAPTLATVRMRYEKPGADSAATERVTTFPTSALRSSATSASRDTRLAYSAATFAEVLRGSPHAQEVKIDRLITFAREAARPGETDDAELIALMKKAADLGANGGNAMISAR